MFFNAALVFPKSKSDETRRRLLPIYGQEVKTLGYEFKPIYHNWTYSFSAEGVQKMLDAQGLGKTKDAFQGVLMDERMMKYFKEDFKQKAQIDPFASVFEKDGSAKSGDDLVAALLGEAQSGDLEKDFVENVLPRLDAGLKYTSALGTTSFILHLLHVGSYLGFNSKFMVYILANIATTEATSYAINEYTEQEMCGNSIFGYTNYAITFMLWWQRGFKKSSWVLNIATLLAFSDFIAQFFIPAASKILHLEGLLIGVLWWMYGYKKKLPF